MNERIQALVTKTQERLGLTHHDLKRYQLNRHVNTFKETIYTLSMGWFPKGKEETEDGLNPIGTAVVEMNINHEKYNSIVFVEGKTYARHGIKFEEVTKASIIQWVEAETGLSYEKHFQLQKEESNHLIFQGIYEGIKFVPSAYIEVKWDHDGHLTFFSINGDFPSDKMFEKGSYRLNLNDLEDVFKDQVQLIHFPSYEDEKLLALYGVEEIYITNNQARKIPFDPFFNPSGHEQINQKLIYNQADAIPFERKEIKFSEDVTVEQVFSTEKSPETYPITKDQQDVCIASVKGLLAEAYPNDSGFYVLKTLHRETNYIYATLRSADQTAFAFQRKLTVIMDANDYHVINYIDNQTMLDIFDEYEKPAQVKITKDEAYEILKSHFALQARYIYDDSQKKYILCGKLDCNYGVRADSGELVSLDEF